MNDNIDANEIVNEWVLRVGDGTNFKKSAKYNIWCIRTFTNKNNQKKNIPCAVHFMNNVKKGDRLWFVTGNSNGKIIAVATFQHYAPRELVEFGSLIDSTLTNDEFGYVTTAKNSELSNIEIHYTNRYVVECINLHTYVKCRSSIILFTKKDVFNLGDMADDEVGSHPRQNMESQRSVLLMEYNNIVKYSKITVDFVNNK